MRRALYTLWIGVLLASCYIGASAQSTVVVTPVNPGLNVQVPGGPTATAATIPPTLFGVFGGGAVELGQNVTLQVSFVGTGADQTYQWHKDGSDLPGATASTYILAAAAPADAGTYSVSVSNAAGTSIASTNLTVKPIAPLVITTQPRPTIIQVGQAATFSFFATGSYPRTYQWRKDGNDLTGAKGSIFTIAAASTTDAGVYSVVIANSQGTVTSDGGLLTVNPATPPVISTGTPYDATYAEGQQAGFSVFFSSGSAPFTYQWLKDGTPISGATNAQLVFNAVALTDAGSYSVVVANAAGSATSRAATLTVTRAVVPVIGTPPQNQTIAQGQSASFSVSLSSGTSPVTYQWLKDGTAIAGATSSSYYTNAVTFADAGNYSVVATNIAGSVTSTAAVLTVNPAVLPSITVPPQSQTVNYYDSITLGVQVAGSSPFTYQWKKDGVALTNSNSSGYSVFNATLANGGTYTVVVTNAAGSVTSAGAVVTVRPAIAPAIVTQPADRTANYYDNLSLGVQVTGSGPLTYQWMKDGVTLSSGGSNNLYLYNVTPADNGTYTVVVANSAGSVTSSGAVVTVNPAVAPTIATQPQSQTLNYNDTLSLSVPVTGSSPLTYQWRKDGVNLPNATSSYFSLYGVTPANNGTYTVVITNPAGSVTSAGAVVTVNPAVAPSITTQPLSQTLSYYNNLSFTVGVAGSGPMTFQWRKDGVAVSSGTSSYYSISNVTPADNGTYTVVVTNPAGSVTSLAAIITVNPAVAPAITTQPLGQTLSYNATLSLNVVASGSAPMTYQWKKDGVALASGNSSSYSFSNATPAINGTYSVVVTNPAGSVTSAGAVVTVNPAVAPAITTQPANLTLNYNDYGSLNVGVSGSSPMTYQWKKDGVALASGNSSSYSFSNATPANNGTYTVVVTNPAGSVTSAGAVVTVNPAVAPTITTQPASQTLNYYDYCNLNVGVSGSGPMTFQWKKDGVALASGNSSNYSFSSATPANNGTYTVVVTNSAGSVTSNGAVITVKSAVAPTITTQPASQTLNYYDTINLSVAVTGSAPLSYQWKKDGVALSSANSASYYLSNATPANNGTYSVDISNPAGSVTSAGAVVTVKAAVAPSITVQPANQTVPYNGSLNVSVQVAGTNPLTFQWKKDGVALPSSNSSSYAIYYSATPANSGTYTVVVTNSAGSVTSAGAVVTVSPPAVPVITTQPVSAQVAVGLPASFSVNFNNAGTGPLTVQWLQNGSPISGATYSNYSIANVKESDAGDYVAVITGPGGVATSTVATLTVLPPAPPQVTYWPYSGAVSIGGSASLNLNLYNVTGAGPFTYQWAKEGVPIAGATSASLNFSNIAFSDLGTYTLTISNAGGVVTSPPIRLYLGTDGLNPPAAWLDAKRQGNIVYFLATVPSRIERYDLAGERWLPTVTLGATQVPTAFLPLAEGVYIAYGRALALRTLDLATETPLTNATTAVTQFLALDDLLYFAATNSNGGTVQMDSLHRSTLQPGPSSSVAAFPIAIAAGQRKGFSTGNYSGVNSYVIGTDGKFTASTNSPYFYDVIGGTRMFVFPNEDYFANNGGTVFHLGDLTYAGSFGDGFSDLIFLGDGSPVVLRGNTVQALHGTGLVETGRATVPFAGVRAFNLAANVFVFGAPDTAGNAFRVAKVSTASLTLPVAPVIAATDRFSIDDAFLSPDGVVHVVSRSQQALLRWSASTRTYLASVPLRSAPKTWAQTPGGARALFVYGDGQITQVPLQATAATETQLSTVGNNLIAITDLGDMMLLNISQVGSSGDLRLVLGSQGQALYLSTWNYWGTGLAWQSILRRFYSTNGYASGISYLTVPTSGVLPTTPGSIGSTGSTSNATAPLRFNLDGTLCATGNGCVFNADLAQVGSLGNNIADAAWLPSGLYTVRNLNGDTQVQQWAGAHYLQTGSLTIRGAPVRLFRLSDTQLVVVTSVLGYVSFSIVNSDLTLSTVAGSPVTIATQPQSQTVAPSAAVTLSLTQKSTSGPPIYTWSKNGVPILGAAGPSLTLDSVQPANTGLYTGLITTPSGSAMSDPAILGLATTSKVIGAGAEVGSNIFVASAGNTYDQVLLQGSAATITADAGQITRISFLDLTNDIVQVEFGGAGTLSLVLDNPTGPTAPANYNQPNVTYMKGHAGIVITGANETTNVSVFSVGRVTAVNQALFRSDVTYDGLADLAYIAISSANGKFGGVRTANASYYATKGFTGLYAPGVQFTGPVYVGDINAFDAASPVLVLGSAATTQINGGDLAQANGQPVKVSGVTRLQFVAGSTSHGGALPAQNNKARLLQNGVDVTTQIVVNPGPPPSGG